MGTRRLNGFRILPRHEATLHRTIANCKEAGSEVVLITPPLTSQHRRTHTAPIEAEYLRFLEATGCRHVDCRDWMEDGWFYDTHHLTVQGGSAYAMKLAERVLVPWAHAQRLASR